MGKGELCRLWDASERKRKIVVVLGLSLVLGFLFFPFTARHWGGFFWQFVGVLSDDICLLTGNADHSPIVLPKGMSVYVPKWNDYGVTAPDDTALYKIYIRSP
jgi:hypothetical protein